MTAPTTNPHAAKPAPEPRAADDEESITLPRQELQALVHDLRNHLNSMLMNAGVLAMHCGAGEKVSRLSGQVEADGAKCALALKTISDRYL